MFDYLGDFESSLTIIWLSWGEGLTNHSKNPKYPVISKLLTKRSIHTFSKTGNNFMAKYPQAIVKNRITVFIENGSKRYLTFNNAYFNTLKIK
jgi:hypothetical protein